MDGWGPSVDFGVDGKLRAGYGIWTKPFSESITRQTPGIHIPLGKVGREV
jgi:hypothetical protein